MRDRQGRCPSRKRSGASAPPLALIGALLLTAGLLLLFLCVPGWAWAALLGVLLAGVGTVLIHLGGR